MSTEITNPPPSSTLDRSRWNEMETKKIAEIRARLGPLLLDRPQFPDVVGDRKLVRFLRGHDHNVDKVCEMVTNFLKWRDDNNMDEVRERIIRGGLSHPRYFPLGEKILSLIPQVVIAYDACDKFGAPICVDQYNFSPAVVMASISVPDYIVFQAYCLEYKMMIVEQLSEHREQQALQSAHSHNKGATGLGGDAASSAGSTTVTTTSETTKGHEKTTTPVSTHYGVLVNTCVIRDLGAVGFEHVGARGQEIIQAVISLAGPNYPELMRKCFMINAPWVFNALWYFIKGLLPARTVAKVDLMGSGFMAKIEEEISLDNLPSLVGGKHTNDAPFAFDLEYYAASPYFLRSCPMKGTSTTVSSTSSAISNTSGGSGNSTTSSSSVVSGSSSSGNSHNGITIEDVDGTVLTLSSSSIMTDLAHPLCVTVSTGTKTGGKTGAGTKTGTISTSASSSEITTSSHHHPSTSPPSCSGSQPVPMSSAYAVQLARFFSWATANALIFKTTPTPSTTPTSPTNNNSPSSSSPTTLHCISRIVIDFDCGGGLLACMLATLIHQTTSGSSPNPGASPGASSCVRAVCCQEDISNGCFDLLHKNTSLHAGSGLAATTPTESSLTLAASVVTNNATKSIVTAASSSSTTPIPTSKITLHEYHHAVTTSTTNASAPGVGSASATASGPGLGSGLSYDRCPFELLTGADTIVLRMETFLRTKTGDCGGHKPSHHNATHLHITDKSIAADPHHSNSHNKGKTPGHTDHHSHPSSSFSPSSSLQNLEHFCSSLFTTKGDVVDTTTPTSSTITTVLLAVQASTARIFMNTEHDLVASGSNQPDKENSKENSKDKITLSSVTSKPVGMRLSVEGAKIVAQALKKSLSATLATNMCVVTSPDNRCHFIVATATSQETALDGAGAAGGSSEHGVALEWSVHGQMV